MNHEAIEEKERALYTRLRSLKSVINRLKEEIALFEARAQPAAEAK